MSLGIVFLCLAVVTVIYFYNNPLNHGSWFLSRRFINWFPLGMTYAFLYMGRYNLTVAKNALVSDQWTVRRQGRRKERNPDCGIGRFSCQYCSWRNHVAGFERSASCPI